MNSHPHYAPLSISYLPSMLRVGELDAEKLAPLLKLRYRNTLADVFADLGRPDEIRNVFVSFQRHLYARADAVGQQAL